MIDRPFFSSRLVLPLSWRVLDGAPSPADREAAAWANAGVFRFLLHGIDVDAAVRPADERFAEVLAPIRTKLDTLIEMVGRLSYRDTERAPRREIDLSLDRIAWPSPAPVPVGSWLELRIYFHPTFLEPVVLHARVGHCAADGSGDGYRIQADVPEMSDSGSEAFARLTFLAQRRQLAERAAAAAAAR